VFEGYDVEDKESDYFIAWQTWENLNRNIHCFDNFVEDFLQAYPDYYILPIRVTGSKIESFFSIVQSNKGSSAELTVTTYSDSITIMKGKEFYEKYGESHEDYRTANLFVLDHAYLSEEEVLTLVNSQRQEETFDQGLSIYSFVSLLSSSFFNFAFNSVRSSIPNSSL
jgi:hypothetical protein